MEKCWAQPVTPEIQITMTKCCSPKTPEDVSKVWHLFGGRQGRQQLATTKPYRMHTLHSNTSPAIWRNYQKCRHRCMGTDVNQSHLFLPRQAECPILWAVCGLKAQARKGLKNEGDQAGTGLSQSVKCLPCKYGDQSSVSRIHLKCLVAYICYQDWGGGDWGIPGAHRPDSLA